MCPGIMKRTREVKKQYVRESYKSEGSNKKIPEEKYPLARQKKFCSKVFNMWIKIPVSS